MGLSNPGLTLEPGRTAMVLTDLQNDFLFLDHGLWTTYEAIAMFADLSR